MRCTSWPTETGCKADHAPDQARTDNGSQETVRKASTRATVARFSPVWRVLLLAVQGRRIMAGGAFVRDPPVTAGGWSRGPAITR